MRRRPDAWIITGLALLLSSCSVACNITAKPPRHTFPNEKVQFVNERTGWIVGPRLLRTDDGGNSWRMIRSDGPGTIVSEFIDNEQARIQFVDDRVGFMLGRRREIYKSVDGGGTWTETVSPVVEEQTEKLHIVFFLSPTKGWIFGKNAYRTDDGAVTWSRLGPTPLADDTRIEKPRVSEGYAPAVWVLNDSVIVLVRKDGDVYRSEDGGAKWQRVWSVNNFLLQVYFADDKSGWIVGDNGFMGRTTDGGASWQQIKVPTSDQLDDVFFLNDQKGWAVGAHGAIIYTTDGGTSWLSAQVKIDGFRARLADVCFVDEKRGWAVGGEPFDDIAIFQKTTNLILESHDGGQTWSPAELNP
jgi:photosystem II stability/assembly factor-like uncharacterized protein